MNKFQKFMTNPANQEVSKEIAKLYHPDLEVTVTTLYKYDWAIIKGKGISIGVEFNVGLLGKGHPMESFEKSYENNSFYAWRFVDDSKYKRELISQNNPDVNEILIKHNVPRPTAKEMFNYYYLD